MNLKQKNKQVKFLFLSVATLFSILMISSFVSSSWDNSLNVGLKGYWSFDTLNGDTLPDSLGLRNGTIVNSSFNADWTTNSSCKLNGCVFFDNSVASGTLNQARVNLSNVMGLINMSKPVTVSFWFKANVLTPNINTFMGSHNFFDPMFKLYYQDAGWGTISNYIKDESGGVMFNNQPSETFGNNQWYHVVWVYQGDKNASNIKLYQDGNLTSFNKQTNSLVGETPIDTFSFGANPLGDYGYYGYMDEISIWNRTLSDAEVLKVYNNNLATTYSISSPTIQFVSPTDENGDSEQRQNIIVNVTSSANNITINFYNSTHNLIQSVNNLSANFYYNYSAGTDGIFYFNATSCDSDNLCNSTETRFVSLDTFNPVIDILYPADLLYIGQGYYNYFVNSTNFTAVNTGSLDKCWIVLNGNSPIFVPNCTEGSVMSYTGLNTTEGLNNLTIYANDTVSLLGSHTHTFIIDTIPPTLQIISPINATIYTSRTQLLNISTNGSLVIYSINGVNHTYTTPSNVLFDEGANTLRVYSYDSVNNTAISTIYFTVNTPTPATPPAYLSNPVYTILNGTGAGLGIFIQLLAQALPLLLIGLAFVGIIAGVGYAISLAITKFRMK